MIHRIVTMTFREDEIDSFLENEEALNAYRHSELFRSTWAKTKVLFAEKPIAFSTNAIRTLD